MKGSRYERVREVDQDEQNTAPACGEPLTEVETPTFLDLVDRYLTFAKASAENIIALAKTVKDAKDHLSENELDMFCDRVRLNRRSSTFRKLMKIGENAARFEPFIEKLPSAWTTVYKLAMLSDAEFDTPTTSHTRQLVSPPASSASPSTPINIPFPPHTLTAD
jgi:hypothetical protein